VESGRRWNDEDIPKTQWNLPGFLWFPGAELYGIRRIEHLDDVLVLANLQARLTSASGAQDNDRA
jgi:cholesterol oxidase